MDTPGNYSQLGGRGKRFRFFSRYEKAHQYRELPEKEVPRKRKTTGKTATGNLPPAGQKLPRMERPRIGFVRSPEEAARVKTIASSRCYWKRKKTVWLGETALSWSNLETATKTTTTGSVYEARRRGVVVTDVPECLAGSTVETANLLACYRRSADTCPLETLPRIAGIGVLVSISCVTKKSRLFRTKNC